MSTSGHEVTLVDGGIRVVAPPGQVRNGRKVEPYRSEEVRFRNEDVELAGSVFVPPGPGPHPGVVLVSGSGAVDRGGLLGYASLFARHGIAALAYDKRGTGGSSGRYRLMADYQALAGDLLAGVQHLRARPDVDPGRVGVWGNSEGGLVAPLAASRSSEVAFVVAVSPPGVALIRAILWQSQQHLLRAWRARLPPVDDSPRPARRSTAGSKPAIEVNKPS